TDHAKTVDSTLALAPAGAPGWYRRPVAGRALMWRSLRSRRLFWLIPVGIIALAFALYHIGRRPRLPAFEPADFTPGAASLREAAQDANVVICVLDAARADHLGCYGYPRETTPNIDRLARESVRFDSHYCQHVTTKPSTASLFTSQYTDTHLATDTRHLLAGTFTMAQGLAAAGLQTVLFSSNPNASPGVGIGLDFQETYDQRDVEPLVDGWEELTSASALVTLIEDWVKKHHRKRFFMYLHFDPPHQPYIQPDEMTKLFEGRQPPDFQLGDFAFPVEDREMLRTCARPPLPEWINLYDANLRYGDWAVGEVERLLRDAGVFDETLFIVTADHGEAFGEHGYLWHERGVYEELTRIPLLIRFPGGAQPAETVGALTQTIDLLPTIFDTLMVPYPREGIQGRSLLPVLLGDADTAHDSVFCRSDGKPPSYLVRSPGWALMLWGNGEWRALYDLEADPDQRANVIAERPEVAEKMVAAFRTFAREQRRPPLDFLDPAAKLPPLPEAGVSQLTPEMKKRLRALGYVK
ncbi:MAG: sulfatase-like hydrolase/transferase, partial [Armatimonadetes bacterium]|nr:sulfatase-like hydrolase/transferase [Armatimonadota bacterium]